MFDDFWSRLSSPNVLGLFTQPYLPRPAGGGYMPVGGTTEEGGAPRWVPPPPEQQPVTRPTSTVGPPVAVPAPASRPAPFYGSAFNEAYGLTPNYLGAAPVDAFGYAPGTNVDRGRALGRIPLSDRRTMMRNWFDTPGMAAAEYGPPFNEAFGYSPSRSTEKAAGAFSVSPVTPAMASLEISRPAPVSAAPRYDAESGPQATSAPDASLLTARRARDQVNTESLNAVFAQRLARAIADAEAATGQKAVLQSGYRSREEQAAAYNRFLRGQTALAAPPGRSRHEFGEAVDLAPGPVLDWLHRNAHRYGLEFLRGSAFARDPIHVQLRRGDY